MSSFSGRVTFEGDRTTGGKLLADAIHYAEKLSAWKQTTGLSNVSRTYDLGNGSFVIINDLEHLKAIHIVTTPELSTSEFEAYFPYSYSDNLGVMDVISGKVISPIIITEPIEYELNGETVIEYVEVLKKFTPTYRVAERYSDVLCRHRIGIEEYPTFRPMSANPDITYSEHAHVKPSCYSGSMREVIQLLLGVGRVVTPTWEERWIKENDRRKLDREIVVEEGGIQTQVTSGFGLYHESNQNTVTEVQLRYDYRSFRTHGISFDDSGVPWVIQISKDGVFAMPLYMDPVSLAFEGKNRYLEVNPELSEFFKKFGGFPLGIPFPISETLDAYVRAGEIVRLVSVQDMDKFYKNHAYSTAMGWCFNSKGTEAHNTCYGYGDDGVGIGYHYAVSIRLVGETLPEWTEATGTMASLLGLSKTYEIKKARRMDDGTAEGIIEMIKDGNFESAKEAFDDATVDPTLDGSASIRSVRSGRLYHPAIFKRQPQIKFHEPVLDGLLSHDFSPIVGQGDKLIKCNTPMHVFFVNDAIEVINYFYDPRKAKPPESINTRQECQFVGGWEAITKRGDGYAVGNFYSSRWDWRDVIYPEDAITKYNGKNVGEQNYAAADSWFGRCIQVHRIASYLITNKHKTVKGRSVNVSVAIPMNDRCACYMTKHEGISGVSEHEGAGYEHVHGSITHIYIIQNWLWHWFGSCSGGTQDAECTAIMVGSSVSNSCFEAAPDAMSYSVCPKDYKPGVPITVSSSWGGGIIGSAVWPTLSLPSTWFNSKQLNEPKQSFEIWFIDDSGHGPIRARHESLSGKDPATGNGVDIYSLNFSGWWWKASPDADSGAVCHIAATHSCLGGDVLNYQDDIEGDIKHKGGPAYMEGSQFTCYTGVID